jgi:uncharacterized protein YjiK
MNPTRLLFALALIGVATLPLHAQDGKKGDGRKADAKKEKDSPEKNDGDRIGRSELPADLLEVSGIALIRDGVVLAHNDNQGKVWEIDYRTGKVLKKFSVGTPAVSGDFEGIAVAGNRIYMLTSTGDVYEFAEGQDNGAVQYKRHSTGLGAECEFEGLAYDAASQSLLLACKNILARSQGDGIRVYKWKAGSTQHPTPLNIPLSALSATKKWKQIRPSEIAIDPATGNYVIISSADLAIMAVTPAGKVVFARELPSGHQQPEGLVITKDGTMIISDEGGPKSAPMITLYKWTGK